MKDINEALNYVVDTLLFAGAALVLAAAKAGSKVLFSDRRDDCGFPFSTVVP
jgi:hypothetical protein